MTPRSTCTVVCRAGDKHNAPCEEAWRELAYATVHPRAAALLAQDFTREELAEMVEDLEDRLDSSEDEVSAKEQDRATEYTVCLRHEVFAKNGSCEECGGDRNLVQVRLSADAIEFVRLALEPTEKALRAASAEVEKLTKERDEAKRIGEAEATLRTDIANTLLARERAEVEKLRAVAGEAETAILHALLRMQQAGDCKPCGGVARHEPGCWVGALDVARAGLAIASQRHLAKREE